MLVSTEAGAGQILSGHDDTRFYDDIGCVAADWRSRRDDAIAFVHASSGEWLDVHAAFFARPEAARTAMASSFVAYASAAEAGTADRDGRALTWDDVVERVGGGR